MSIPPRARVQLARVRQQAGWVVAAALAVGPLAADAAEKVAVDNFVRAETDTTLERFATTGGFGQFTHIRQPTPIDKQAVIRMNLDTLYSATVFDLVNGPATIIKAANALQDRVGIQQADKGRFEVRDWDEASLAKLRNAIKVLAATKTDACGVFGVNSQLNPIDHLLSTASGCGGHPKSAAMYVNVVPEKNDGTTPHTLTVKDVPVDGFRSVTVCNDKGFTETNGRLRLGASDCRRSRHGHAFTWALSPTAGGPAPRPGKGRAA